MKAKLFTVAVASTLFFAACKHAPTEQTMKDIAAFETKWTEMSTKATGLGTDLQTAFDACNKTCEQTAAVATEGLKEEAKTTFDAAVSGCKADKTTFEELKKNWDAEGATWAEVQTQFTDLKEKATKGTITNDEATKLLAELNTKLDAGNKGLDEWAAKVTAAKETCTKNCTTVSECCKKIEEEAAAKGAKKK